MINFNDNYLTSLILKKIVYGLKTSFEDLGQDFTDVLYLKSFCDYNHIPLVLKIGGALSIEHLKSANKLNIINIVAPMILTKFALLKFINSCNNFLIQLNNNLAINIETITAVNNIDDILSSEYIDSLKRIVLGRVDLTSSMGYKKYMGDVESTLMANLVELVFSKVKSKDLECILGGSISSKSKSFIYNLYNNSLIDKFETRNVIFNVENINFDEFHNIINAAVLFLLQLLEYKHLYYSKLANQDLTRIKMLKNRCGYVEKVITLLKHNVCIDFDGVIHNDNKGFDDGTIYGNIILGAKEAIINLSKKYNIIIHTAKAKPDRPIINGKTGELLI